MMLTDIHILSVESSVISAWFTQGVSIISLPDTQEVTCLWLTLENRAVVQSDIILAGNLERVIILYYADATTSPQHVQSMLEHFCATTKVNSPDLRLVLTGYTTPTIHKEWECYFSLSTPGNAPENGLLFHFLIRYLLPEHSRIRHLLRRILRGIRKL